MAGQHRPLVLADKRLARRVACSASRAVLCAAALAPLWGALRRLGPPLLRRVLASAFGLSPPLPGSIRRVGGLLVPGGSEGVHLATTAYVREGGPSPTLLIRTPYDKKGLELLAYTLAGQGFNVVLQDCRGRYASTGAQTFAAFEDVDGVATVDWLASQGFEWYDPARVVMFGISYLGIVQWALVAGLRRRCEGAGAGGAGGGCAEAAQVRLAAIAPLFAASRVHDIFFRHNAFAFDFYMRYVHLMTKVNSFRGQILSFFHLLTFEFRLRRHGMCTLGNKSLSRKLGLPVLFKYNPRPQSRFWQDRDYSDAVLNSPPALIATGWHDLMLDGSLRDFSTLVQAHGLGHARLLVGPWHHLESVLSPAAFRTLLRTSVDFLQERTGLVDLVPDAAPVRLWIMGGRCHQGGWRDFSSWPPAEASEELLLLSPGAIGAARHFGGDEHPAAQPRSRLRYDPLDPTPSLGGSVFNPFHAGEKEQGRLEARGDVLRFDTPPLPLGAVVVGQARLRLLVRASRSHFDIFARLCDVHPTGRSFNVCDAVLRRRGPTERSQSHGEVQGLAAAQLRRAAGAPADAAQEPAIVECELTFAATAKSFGKGHRIRLLVTCGAFPRFARHFGDAEQAIEDDPLEVAPCELEVLHTEQLPSALWLPIAGAVGDTPKRRRSLVEAMAETQVLSPRHVSREALGTRRLTKELSVSLRKVQSEAML